VIGLNQRREQEHEQIREKRARSGIFEGRTIWIVDARRDDGKHFIVHADEKQTAFRELESVARGLAA
jgi:hypothetical protein